MDAGIAGAVNQDDGAAEIWLAMASCCYEDDYSGLTRLVLAVVLSPSEAVDSYVLEGFHEEEIVLDASYVSLQTPAQTDIAILPFLGGKASRFPPISAVAFDETLF